MRNYLITILLLCVANFFLYMGAFLPEEGAMRGGKAFPSRIGSLASEDVPYDSAVIGALRADHVVYKQFRKNEDVNITLFVALYEGLEKTDFSHSPIVCSTGQGWEIEKQTKEELRLGEANQHRIRVNQLIERKMDTRMVTLFWYQSCQGVFLNRGLMKLSLFYNRLLGRSGHNAFVRVTAVVPEKKSVEETAASLGAFVREAYPSLSQYVLH